MLGVEGGRGGRVSINAVWALYSTTGVQCCEGRGGGGVHSMSTAVGGGAGSIEAGGVPCSAPGVQCGGEGRWGVAQRLIGYRVAQERLVAHRAAHSVFTTGWVTCRTLGAQCCGGGAGGSMKDGWYQRKSE